MPCSGSVGLALFAGIRVSPSRLRRPLRHTFLRLPRWSGIRISHARMYSATCVLRYGMNPAWSCRWSMSLVSRSSSTLSIVRHADTSRSTNTRTKSLHSGRIVVSSRCRTSSGDRVVSSHRSTADANTEAQVRSSPVIALSASVTLDLNACLVTNTVTRSWPVVTPHRSARRWMCRTWGRVISLRVIGHLKARSDFR